jgi:transcription termination/antitermination protein NusG
MWCTSGFKQSVASRSFLELKYGIVSEKGGALSLAIRHPLYDKQASSTAEMPAPGSYWFAVQTRPRHEKKVNSGLSERGITSFLPLYREKRRWSDRHQWVELPLFSQYLFVRVPIISAEARVRVLQTPGVVQFVGMPGRGTPVPDEQIDNLQLIVDQKIPMAPHEFMRIGERVRIRGGALNGIEGLLAAIKNETSFVVSVDLIQKSVAIRIEGFEVERA